jgi:hypothetical protein
VSQQPSNAIKHQAIDHAHATTLCARENPDMLFRRFFSKFWTMVVMDQMTKLIDDDVVHDPTRTDVDLPVELHLGLG